VPDALTACHLPHARTPDSSANVPSIEGIPCQQTRRHETDERDTFERVCEIDGSGRGADLRVVAAHQWVSTTAGRRATDPYSWMQAVHWVGGSGLYIPSRKHGPKWGPTTVVIAQLVSALTECRPGVDWIARRLEVSERTVQYHLDMLREAGLLAYRYKGTRISRGVNRASEYERIIPPQFDEALGIRTTGEGVQRRPVGIAEHGRKLIGKLARKAARKVRRRRPKTPVSSGSRCTPMQGGTSGSSTAGSTGFPSEAELASGQADSPTPKSSSKTKVRKLNKVGRRHQLARELIAQVPWLAGASAPRIAWIVRHVADAGWTALEVQAIAEQDNPLTAADVRRVSGMLAHRLKGVHDLYPTAAQRARLVDHWRESRIAEHARHDGYEQGITGGPARMSVRRIMSEAMDRMRTLTAGPAAEETAVEIQATDEVRLEDLDRATVIDLRAAAMKDPAVIHLCIDLAGETYARRLYTNRLVDQALRGTSTTLRIHTWQEANRA
jgi:DNA-binding transcriptional ArsR family regulator